MGFVTEILGKVGLIGVIGFATFIYAFRYSHQIFEWIENQTFGTRNYILEKLELLFIEIKPDHITYLLLFLSFGLGVIVLGIMGLMSMWALGIILAIIVSILGWRLPRPFINFLVQKRTKLYQSQMVDALTLLSNGLRAGLSVPQSIAMVVDELPAPISQEYNLILQQNKIGVPLEECFESLVKRVPTEDNEMFVSSMNILRETGGNLAETFDTIVLVIRERIRLQQKIDTYTAQGMFQGMTIAAMPFVLGGIFYTSDPENMSKLFTTPVGLLILFVAVGLDFIGAMVIMKIVRIKI